MRVTYCKLTLKVLNYDPVKEAWPLFCICS